MKKLFNAILQTYFAICVFMVSVIIFCIAIFGGRVLIEINWESIYLIKEIIFKL